MADNISARVKRVRNPQMRREDLLVSAEALFATAGYDETSIDQIIARAGTSKGGFYHHFGSKDDLLEALAARAAEQALAGIEGVFAAPDLSAVQRLNRFLQQGRGSSDRARDAATFGAIFRPENLALYHRLHRAVTRVLVEPLARIIEQGRREGTMHCEHPLVTAEIVLMLGPVTHDAVAEILSAPTQQAFDRAIDVLRIRLVQQALAVDRILGLPDGTLSFWSDGIAAAWTFSANSIRP